jgi:hypothetical protein
MRKIQVVIVALAALGLATLGRAQTAPQAPPSAKPGFVDNNGDGICDNCTGTGQRAGKGNGKRRGPGDSTGYQGQGPRDGSGYGAGSGACDGTGPKGQGRGRRGGRG